MSRSTFKTLIFSAFFAGATSSPALAQDGSIVPENGPVVITAENGKHPTEPFRACVPGTGQPTSESRTFHFGSRSGERLSIYELGIENATGVWNAHTVRNSSRQPIPVERGNDAWEIVRFAPKEPGTYSGTEAFIVRTRDGREIPYTLRYNGIAYDCSETEGLPPIDKFALDGEEEAAEEDRIRPDAPEEGVPSCDGDRCDANPEPDEDEQPAPKPSEEDGAFPPLMQPGDTETVGLGLSGLLEGPCPDGVKTLAIILQFDDANGFDELARRVREGYTKVEATPNGKRQKLDVDVQHLRPVVGEMRKKGSRAFDEKTFIAKLKSILANVDCTCTDVVVTVLAHGKADKNGENHEIVYKDRYVSSGNRYMRKTDLKWSDILSHILRAAHEAKKDCVQLNFALTECYAGAAIGDVEKTVGKFSPPRAKGSVSVFAGSSKKQVCNGKQYKRGGQNVVDVYYVDALTYCLKQHGSLDRAWQCIARRTADGAKRGTGKQQNPQRYPPPSQR
ncbi:MAG: hypothetical protein HRU11_03320 [Parvularculaceae bacterium]|nr:hypothetical protein [Parvularculaceae bacterium]